MQKTLASLVLGLLATPAAAQCFDSSFLTHTPLGVGTLFGDIVFGIQPIGFAFPLGGTPYADIHVCDKGYAWFSNAGTPAPGGADFSATAVELASQSPRVCCLWSDIQALSSNGGQVYISSTPSKCTVTWHNVQTYAATSAIFDMQMQLFPTGQCSFFYGVGATNNSTTVATWQVGVVGVSPGLGVPLPAASDLSAGGVTVDNTIFEEWLTPNTFDMAASSLQLIPTSPGWAYFSGGTGTNCATASNYGTGCLNSPDSFYEFFSSPAAFDLNGRTITMLRQPNGYLVLDVLPGALVPPSGAAVSVAFGDDVVQTVALSSAMPIPLGTTSSLSICSNANIALSAINNGTSFTPDVPTYLAWGQTAVANWHDYNPAAAGSGLILFEQTAVFAYVTWNNVYGFGTTTPELFQFQFNMVTGDITIVFQAMSPAGNGYLVGYSVGGPSPDPGATDLSTALAATLSIGDVGSIGLALTVNSLPTLGNASFGLNSSHVPNVVPLGFAFFGDTQLPGIDLGFLGAPNCRSYTNANLGAFSFPVTLPAGTGTATLPIPNLTGLIGVTLTCQSAAFTLANQLGLVTSNGTSFTVGN